MREHLISSFFTDCQQTTIMQPMASMNCKRVRRQFFNKKNMDVMPADRNCDKIYFILDRMVKRWFKCCKKGLLFKQFYCTEVFPSAWIPQMKDKRVQPLETEEAYACFRMRPQDFWNGEGNDFGHSMEQCVVMGTRGGSSKWALSDTSPPGVKVYMLAAPFSIVALPLALDAISGIHDDQLFRGHHARDVPARCSACVALVYTGAHVAKHAEITCNACRRKVLPPRCRDHGGRLASFL